MKILKTSLLMVVIALGTGCRTTSVTVVEDDNRKFSLNHYQSYDFVETRTDGVFSSEDNMSISLIKDEIVQRMEERGVRRDTVSPELKINLGVQVEERTQTRQTGLVTDPGTFTYIGQRRYAWRSETVETGRYRHGTATLHLIDVHRDEAVWVGIVEKILPRREERLRATIRNGVEKTFEKIDEYNVQSTY
ncbi:DUF4136 domain-containing protein [Anditalea andensis]|nr:DUF4136 domain-containing protein [Anditalea andensis]